MLLLGALCVAIVDARAREPWVTLNDCRYVDNDSNDGDSFHIRSGRKEYIFRLYFVDSPETDLELKERLDEQAKYFGVSVPQTIQIAEAAKSFVQKKLSHPFVVRTCMQDAMGRSKMERFYAFIEVDHHDLGEELVANGLARLHGTETRPPGMNSVEVEWNKLEQLERTAKQQKVGAWGVSVGRLNARVESKEQYSADSFDAFFHPERLRRHRRQFPRWRISRQFCRRIRAAAALTKKLDANTASQQELDAFRDRISDRGANRRRAPFKSADDLRRVKGIGAKKYEKIRPFFE